MNKSKVLVRINQPVTSNQPVTKHTIRVYKFWDFPQPYISQEQKKMKKKIENNCTKLSFYLFILFHLK